MKDAKEKKAKEKGPKGDFWEKMKKLGQFGMGPKKKKLVDTSGKNPRRPELIPGEHPTKFFNRKGEEIIITKTGKLPVRHVVRGKKFGKILSTISEAQTEAERLEQERIHSDDFAKKRKHHGMNYYEYLKFIKDHGGKTPDEVFKQGAWKITKPGDSKFVGPIQHTVVSQVDPELMLYLKEQHGLTTVPQRDWLLQDQEHHAILKSDTILHEQLHLPSWVRVVKEGDVVHYQIDPENIPVKSPEIPVSHHAQQAKTG